MVIKLPGWVSLRCLFLVGIFVFNIADIATTYMAKWAHPHVFNETNYIAILTGNLWLLNTLKIVLVSYFVYSLASKYHRMQWPIVRYLNIYILVLLALMFLARSINNYNVAKLPSEQVVQVSAEVKAQVYTEQIYNMRVMENITPAQLKGSGSVTILPMVFVLNMLQFMVWLSFEKWRNQKLFLASL